MRRLLVGCLCLLCACVDNRPPPPPITVFAAASLARPLRDLVAEFQRTTRVPVRTELGGSLDLTRRVTDLGQRPDVLIVVDDHVIEALVPSYLDWYVRFATNRIVIAYTDRSAHADSITPDNWWRILGREDVSVGRADAAIAPAGRQALTVLRNAETYYDQRGLTDRLAARANSTFVRPDAALLAALLQSGEVDYVLDYESIARQFGFRFVALPADLTPTVVYAAGIPRGAPSEQNGVAFVSFMLSAEGQRILRAANVNTLPTPVAVGSHAPQAIADRARIVPAAQPTAAERIPVPAPAPRAQRAP